MKETKDKIINNAKKVGITLMPFSLYTKFGRTLGYDGGKTHIKNLFKPAKIYFWTNFTISCILIKAERGV